MTEDKFFTTLKVRKPVARKFKLACTLKGESIQDITEKIISDWALATLAQHGVTLDVEVDFPIIEQLHS